MVGGGALGVLHEDLRKGTPHLWMGWGWGIGGWRTESLMEEDGLISEEGRERHFVQVSEKD